MSSNASYIRMREEVREFDQDSSQYCLCKAIDGGCCKRDLVILPEDEEIIVEAVDREAISAATLQRARLRASDDDEGFCPFLGDHGECTIYEHRPIVCMQHGNGGLPKNRALAKKALTGPGNRTIKATELEQFACTACAEHVKNDARIPLSVVGKSIAILVTIQDRQRHAIRTTMNEFITRRFKDS